MTTVVESYREFYRTNQHQPLACYGLIPLGEQGSSRLHGRPYAETLAVDFPFAAACVWEDFEDEAEVASVLELVQYGNLTIASEGCETYWLLLTTGPLEGQVWLLTEAGITPVAPPLTLADWQARQLASGNTFWYEALKNWGSFEYAFFYSHAPKKMVTAHQTVFGVTTRLCADCLQFIAKAARHDGTRYVVTDEVGTRVFEADGSVQLVA